MSDRYYMQMAEYANLTTSQLNAALRDKESSEYKKLLKKVEGTKVTTTKKKKVTRIDLNKQLAELLECDIEGAKLPLIVLETMIKRVSERDCKVVSIPEGRLKAPYQEAVCECLHTNLDLSTATVKVMKSFLQAVKEMEFYK